MAAQRTIPRTAREARKRRYKVIPNLTLESLSKADIAKGLMISTVGAEPDALTWCGPCEPNGYRRCCYQDGQGSWVCHSVKC